MHSTSLSFAFVYLLGMASNSITVPSTGLDEQLFADCGLGDAVFVDLSTVKDDELDENAEDEESEMPVKLTEPGAKEMLDDVTNGAMHTIGNKND